MREIYKNNNVQIHNANALGAYDFWDAPITIISDGPYGVGGYPGDPFKPDELNVWYEAHIKEWTRKATAETTLWFWNTEIGWATVHPILKKHGWEYKNCHTWDKGIGHIAGNVNGKTMRKLPAVTEVCVQYVKKPSFQIDGDSVEMKEWLRREWKRSGLPLSKTNEACGVKDAATRKYFTQCDLWYFPPADAFEKLQQYANQNGEPAGRPYFSIDGKHPLTGNEWSKYRAKFNFPHGVTNVWQEPPVRGAERLKIGQKALHLNQKPLKFMELTIRATSDEGDVIWEPFGGLCSATVAAQRLGRRCFAAEISDEIFGHAVTRLEQDKVLSKLDLKLIDEALLYQNQLI